MSTSAGPVERSGTGRRRIPVCRNCGSLHTRRSHPHNALERLLRTITPVRFHVCAVCGTRGLHFGERSRSREPEVPAVRIPARPSARHRRRIARRERRRLYRTLFLAALLGCAVALAFQRCPGANAAELTGP